MIYYPYEGETFKLDDSKGCYVEVTYKGLTGYFGVNVRGTGTDQLPYFYYVGGEQHVTPKGVTAGNRSRSFNEARDETCMELLDKFRAQEASKTFDSAKYCEELHDAVKNLR